MRASPITSSDRLEQRSLRSGELHVQIFCDGNRLRRLQLPAIVPASLDLEMVQGIIRAAAGFELTPVNTSAFHQKVWEILSTIPEGSVLTYGEVAVLAGSPGAARAVGAACGANPLPLLIPCHRVVGVNGLCGFTGGLDWKRRLLSLEQQEATLFS